jgi:hypothetical protein
MTHVNVDFAKRQQQQHPRRRLQQRLIRGKNVSDRDGAPKRDTFQLLTVFANEGKDRK